MNFVVCVKARQLHIEEVSFNLTLLGRQGQEVARAAQCHNAMPALDKGSLRVTMSLATASIVCISFPAVPSGMLQVVMSVTFASWSYSSWFESSAPEDAARVKPLMISHDAALITNHIYATPKNKEHLGRSFTPGSPSVNERPSTLGVLLAVDVPKLLLRQFLQELPLPRIIQKPLKEAPRDDPGCLRNAQKKQHTSQIRGRGTWAPRQ